MLTFLRGKASDRKLRLFAAASFRRSPRLLVGDWQRILDLAERYADGVAERRAPDPYSLDTRPSDDSWLGWYLIAHEASDAARFAFWNATESRRTVYPERRFGRFEELRFQLAFLRDIFGNPFRPVTLNPD